MTQLKYKVTICYPKSRLLFYVYDVDIKNVYEFALNEAKRIFGNLIDLTAVHFTVEECSSPFAQFGDIVQSDIHK